VTVENNAPEWLVLLLAIPSLISAFAAFNASRRSKRIDDAVNHRHPNEPRLFDLAKSSAIWQEEFDRRIDQLEEALLHHVVWEEQQKYPTIEEIARSVRSSDAD